MFKFNDRIMKIFTVASLVLSAVGIVTSAFCLKKAIDSESHNAPPPIHAQGCHRETPPPMDNYDKGHHGKRPEGTPPGNGEDSGEIKEHGKHHRRGSHKSHQDSQPPEKSPENASEENKPAKINS